MAGIRGGNQEADTEAEAPEECHLLASSSRLSQPAFFFLLLFFY